MKKKFVTLAVCFAVTVASALIFAAVAFTTVYYTRNENESGTAAELSDSFANGVASTLSEGIYGSGIKKINIIPESATAGSKPNPENFKSTTDKAEVLEAAQKAAEYGLVKLEELSFSQETVLAKGSKIQYYLDESIFVICWKESGSGTVYNFCEIGTAHSSQLRKYITENKYGSGKRLTTSTMAKDANAVVAINGDFYGYRRDGIVVYQSDICRLRARKGTHHCFIDKRGDLVVTREYLSSSKEILGKFIEENDIRFSLAFGPILVEEGKILSYPPGGYLYGQISQNYSRSAIGQLGSLHYLLCTADGGVGGTKGTTINVFAKKMGEKGCVTAYALDGGQTATIVFNNKVFNRVGYGSERLISDMIYFASSAKN